jgi:hypothetical protein
MLIGSSNVKRKYIELSAIPIFLNSGNLGSEIRRRVKGRAVKENKCSVKITRVLTYVDLFKCRKGYFEASALLAEGEEVNH